MAGAQETARASSSAKAKMVSSKNVMLIDMR